MHALKVHAGVMLTASAIPCVPFDADENDGDDGDDDDDEEE